MAVVRTNGDEKGDHTNNRKMTPFKVIISDKVHDVQKIVGRLTSS